MTQMTPREVLSALDALLEAEKTALLDGDLDTVSSLLAEKSQLIDALNDLDERRRPKLEGIKDKVERNQILLDGALEGIRRVAERLSDLRRLRHSFETYDSQGRKQTIEGQVVRHVEKRA